VVFNDAGYGIAYHGARIRNIPDVGTRYPRVDCAKVAEGLGAQAFHVREPGQINREFMNKILASGRPTVLDVEIDPDEVAPFGGRLETLTDYFTV
jgi:acetolactate synthase-1/2/3 large subunit